MNPVHEFRSDTTDKVLYRCGAMNCLSTYGSAALAERCHVCIRCGGLSGWGGENECQECRTASWQARNDAQDLKDRARPILADHTGPVYVDGDFYEDPWSAAQAIWDNGDDPTEAIAFPCDVRQVGTPDLVDIVADVWASEYDEGYDDPPLPKAVKAALREAEKVCHEHAPEVWVPSSTHRIVLPAIESDE